jgi:hypothetical protein
MKAQADSNSRGGKDFICKEFSWRKEKRKTAYWRIGEYLGIMNVWVMSDCQRMNKIVIRGQVNGGRPPRLRPFQSIQIDFLEIPRMGLQRYLLAIVDHFIGHSRECHQSGLRADCV